MTIYGPNGGVVVGQPISPFFGAQNGANAAAPIVQQPTTAPVAGGMQATGVQMSMLEACSRGLVPRNVQLSTISGQAVSAGISQSQGNALPLDEALSSGSGAQMNLGVAEPPNANTPNSVETSGVNTQVFVGGVGSANDALSTGPTTINLSSVVSAPLAGSTTTANVTLVPGGFQG